jgi:hypothetical protein
MAGVTKSFRSIFGYSRIVFLQLNQITVQRNDVGQDSLFAAVSGAYLTEIMDSCTKKT